MLWEGEPLAATRERLAERGIRAIVFSPMGNRPASGDFATGMNANIQNLSQTLTR